MCVNARVRSFHLFTFQSFYQCCSWECVPNRLVELSATSRHGPVRAQRRSVHGGRVEDLLIRRNRDLFYVGYLPGNVFKQWDFLGRPGSVPIVVGRRSGQVASVPDNFNDRYQGR